MTTPKRRPDDELPEPAEEPEGDPNTGLTEEPPDYGDDWTDAGGAQNETLDGMD